MPRKLPQRLEYSLFNFYCENKDCYNMLTNFYEHYMYGTGEYTTLDSSGPEHSNESSSYFH